MSSMQQRNEYCSGDLVALRLLPSVFADEISHIRLRIIDLSPADWKREW
jgi:hypothetical protein